MLSKGDNQVIQDFFEVPTITKQNASRKKVYIFIIPIHTHRIL